MNEMNCIDGPDANDAIRKKALIASYGPEREGITKKARLRGLFS